MRIVVVWKDNTEYAREVTDWIREMERKVGSGKIESVNPDTVEGEIFCTPREIMEFPVGMALKSDGATVREWVGSPLPQPEDVAYYAEQE